MKRFSDDAPLFASGLLERVPEPGGAQPSLLAQALTPDEAIVSWLLGEYRPHDDLAGHAALFTPGDGEADRVVAGKAWRALQPALQGDGGRPPVIIFHGPDQAGQEAAARLAAATLHLPILSVDLAAAINPDRPALRVLRAALRDASLTGAIALLLGWDACLTPDPAGNAALADLLALIDRHPHWVAIPGRSTWPAPVAERQRHL